MKTLILMRHAKSDWHAETNSDHQRPLNERGEQATEAVGQYFHRQDIRIEKILYSSAKRTTQTAQRVVQSAQWNQAELIMQAEDSLYMCSATHLIEEISKTHHDVNNLMVVNHQPTCSETAHKLLSQWVDFKTASFVIIELNMRDWGGIETAEKKLITHLSPHAL